MIVWCADEVALLDQVVVAQERDADVALLEVEHHALHAVRELEQLAGHRVVEAVDAGDAVADRQDAAGLLDRDLGLVALDLLLDDPADFVGSDLHGGSLSS
jgi:hypothetical protein